MGEKEVCYGCKFYKSNKIPRCTAREELKNRCTYWDKEKQCIKTGYDKLKIESE